METLVERKMKTNDASHKCHDAINVHNHKHLTCFLCKGSLDG